MYFDVEQQALVELAIPAAEPWGFELLPDGLIYRPYLAGPKESRTGTQLTRSAEGGWRFDSSIGGQWGLLRYGTEDPFFPLGVQLDFEASAQLRQKNLVVLDILSHDLRVGLPLSFSNNHSNAKQRRAQSISVAPLRSSFLRVACFEINSISPAT